MRVLKSGSVRRRHVERHGRLVVGPGLVDVEAGLQVEDGPAVLDGHHAAGGEALAVADAVDLVEDGHGGVAGPQEVGVQRVHVAADLDRSSGGHERLAGHLAAEHTLAVLVGGHAAEDVHLDRFEVEQVHEFVECSHATCIVAETSARGTPSAMACATGPSSSCQTTVHP